MSENSAIEWTDHTFNPWEGCQKVGPGCDHCYAETRNARFAGGMAINWGPGAPRRRTSISNWNKPKAWNAAHDTFFAEHGRRQRVFCASLADVFDNAVDPTWRQDLANLIQDTPNLDWLLLTKRIGNAGDMLTEMFLDGTPDNVMIGATVVNQDEVDRDVPKLLRVAAARRFLSMEPLLGPVSFEGIFASTNMHDDSNALAALDWIIVGGESGPGARPMHPDWAREIRDQCKAVGTPFLFKQWGEWAPGECAANTLSMRTVLTADLFNDEWTINKIPGNTEFHCDDEPPLYWVGKKLAGRMLDGVQHDGYPREVAS